MRLFFFFLILFGLGCIFAYQTFGLSGKVKYIQTSDGLVNQDISYVKEKTNAIFCGPLAPIRAFHEETIYTSQKKEEPLQEAAAVVDSISVTAKKVEPKFQAIQLEKPLESPNVIKTEETLHAQSEPSPLFLNPIEIQESDSPVEDLEQELPASPNLYADRLYQPIERNTPEDEKATPVTPPEPETEPPKEEVKKKEEEMRPADQAMLEGKLKMAYELCMKRLEETPCDGRALGTLLKIAKTWGVEKKYRKYALYIYQIADECKPDNAEILFFLGRQLSWMGHVDHAIRTLEHSLQVDPNYTDSAALLAKLYIRQKHWHKAQQLLDQYPHLKDNQFDKATIAFRRRRYAKAHSIYYQMLCKNPEDFQARRGLARTLSAQRKYKAAKHQLSILTHMEPKNDQLWAEYMGIRSHTNVGVFLEGSYTKAKEEDPDIKAPTVRDFYTLAAYHVFIPFSNSFRLDVKEMFFHQKEDDIYPPIGINYNIYVQGVELKTNLQLFRFLKIDTIWRILSAKGFNNNVFFPFVSTTRFEPGASVIYSDPLQYLILNVHVESFIYKNFDKTTSDLLRTFYLHGGYLLRPDIKLKPEIEASFDQVFYHDSLRNVRNTVNLWGRFNIFNPYTRFVYRFEHSHFRHVTENYYTFKRQFRNTLGGVLTLKPTKRLYVEGQYLYRWEYTIGLSQPIGVFTFQTDVQRLQSYRVIMKAGYRIRDYLRIEAAGHIFYSTLPYEDFNVRGSMLWQF